MAPSLTAAYIVVIIYDAETPVPQLQLPTGHFPSEGLGHFLSNPSAAQTINLSSKPALTVGVLGGQ